MTDTIKVKMVHSGIACPPDQRQTLVGLGLRKMNSVRELPNNPSVLGMIRKVSHLVVVVSNDTKPTVKTTTPKVLKASTKVSVETKKVAVKKVAKPVQEKVVKETKKATPAKATAKKSTVKKVTKE